MALKSTARFHPPLSPVECAPAGFSFFFTPPAATSSTTSQVPTFSGRPTCVETPKPAYPYTVHVPPSLRTQNVYGYSVPRTFQKVASPWEVSDKALPSFSTSAVEPHRTSVQASAVATQQGWRIPQESSTSPVQRTPTRNQQLATRATARTPQAVRISRVCENVKVGTLSSNASPMSSRTTTQRTQAGCFSTIGAQQKSAAGTSLLKVSQAAIEHSAFCHPVVPSEVRGGPQSAQTGTGGISGCSVSENASKRATENSGPVASALLKNHILKAKRESKEMTGLHIPAAFPDLPHKCFTGTQHLAQPGRWAPTSRVLDARPTVEQHERVIHSGVGPSPRENQPHGHTGGRKITQPTSQANACSLGASSYAGQTLQVREGVPGKHAYCSFPAGISDGVHSRESTSSTLSFSASDVRKSTAGPALRVSVDNSSSKTDVTDAERRQEKARVPRSILRSKKDRSLPRQQPQKKVVFACPTVSSVSAAGSTRTPENRADRKNRVMYACPTFSSAAAAASTPTTGRTGREEYDMVYSCPTFSSGPAAASTQTPKKQICTETKAVYPCPTFFSLSPAAGTDTRQSTPRTPCFGQMPQTPQQINEAVNESLRAAGYLSPSVHKPDDQACLTRDPSVGLSALHTYRVPKLQSSPLQGSPQPQYSRANRAPCDVQSQTTGAKSNIVYAGNPNASLCPHSLKSIQSCKPYSYQTGAPVALHTTLSTWRDARSTHGTHSSVSSGSLEGGHSPATTRDTRCNGGVVRPVFKRTVHKAQTGPTGSAERRAREQQRNYAAIEQVASAGVTAAAATAAGTLLATASPALASFAVVGVAALLTGLAAASATTDGPQCHRRQHVRRALAAPYSTGARHSTQCKFDYPTWPRSINSLCSAAGSAEAGLQIFQQTPPLASPAVASTGQEHSTPQPIPKVGSRDPEHSAITRQLPDPQLIATKSYKSGGDAGTLLLMGCPMKAVVELKK